MHIMDGVVSSPLVVGAAIVAVSAVCFGLKRIEPDDIPKIALLAAAFFVASVIRVPIGPTSAHLMLTGLLGLVLGPAIFPALLAGLMLQTFIFGFGGITVLGLNLVNMALPGFLAYLIFIPFLQRGLHKELQRGAGDLNTFSSSSDHKIFELIQKNKIFAIGFCAGSFAIAGSLLMVAFSLALSGQAFIPVAKFMVIANLPLIVIEGLFVGVILQFLTSLKPELFAQVNLLHTPALQTSSELRT